MIAVQAAILDKCEISFFVPVKRKGHILDAVFLYKAGNSRERARPFASALFEPRSGAMLEYRNAYINDFADQTKYPMEQKISYAVPFARTAKEQGKLVQTVKGH